LLSTLFNCRLVLSSCFWVLGDCNLVLGSHNLVLSGLIDHHLLIFSDYCWLSRLHYNCVLIHLFSFFLELES